MAQGWPVGENTTKTFVGHHSKLASFSFGHETFPKKKQNYLCLFWLISDIKSHDFLATLLSDPSMSALPIIAKQNKLSF